MAKLPILRTSDGTPFANPHTRLFNHLRLTLGFKEQLAQYIETAAKTYPGSVSYAHNSDLVIELHDTLPDELISQILLCAIAQGLRIEREGDGGGVFIHCAERAREMQKGWGSPQQYQFKPGTPKR